MKRSRLLPAYGARRCHANTASVTQCFLQNLKVLHSRLHYQNPPLVQKRRFLKPDEQTSLLLSEPLHTLLLGSHCTPLTRMMTLEKPMAKDTALPRQQLPWMIFAASHNEYKYQKK